MKPLRKNILFIACWIVIAGILGLYLFSIFGPSVTYWIASQQVRLPDETEIVEMVASLGLGGENEGEVGDFRVPAEHIPKVLTELRPAEVDYNPSPWFFFGTLRLTCANGESITIELYSVGGPRGGAFSITGDWGRCYFRGGNSDRLKDAIISAHEASNEGG